MPVIDLISQFHGDMTAWRRDLHAHPETAFEENRTSDFVAAKLGEFGIEVHRGLAATGVVGTLANGEGGAIGLRADMDALDVTEANSFAHRSARQGKMHACGHDGHVAMLLGAARYLAETRRFSGTVHFIFQPAEEMEGGARRMVEEGLFDRFPMDAVFGQHNWPGLAAGRFAVRPGPVMAAVDTFEVTVRGVNAHAAMPSQGVNSIVAAAHIVNALDALSMGGDAPLESTVLSVTQIHGGESWNVLPESTVLRGTARSFTEAAQEGIEAALALIAKETEAAHGVAVQVRYQRHYPATVNHREQTALAAKVAAAVAGPENVDLDPRPSMGGEDFAFMLQRIPGCYIWIGNTSAGSEGVLHNPSYDFNDQILSTGASYWAKLVETALA